MGQIITYKIGANGDIDDSRTFDCVGAAVHAARMLWLGLDGWTAVYGFATYSDDDRTPIHARTEFWREWRMDETGRVSKDGV